ncbi:inhibitor of nuclear factor kappa-B kinase-interacting protein isoform X1 [Bombina bombina]|uniref:inhibitor of nuclear factor kappa-B kinase-interacting protein isoform X1 n=1 Tax=Bombina bombina TaxID=8345 RepID=UPI00235A5044|nr:inhibitor of nuclear factor kappa-B kinase-interacting protein isoform X1 [Bombina bombina]
MTNVVKQRKKGSNDGKDAQQTTPAAAPRTQTEPQGAGDTLVSGRKSPCPELRTLLCLVCVAICAAMTWLVIQQSRNLAAIELKYQSLQTRPSALNELEDKVRLLFGKLASTEDILAEASTTSAVMSGLKQQVSSVHNDIDRIQQNEQTLFKKMQKVNAKFQNITEAWKKSLDEMNQDTDSVKSEAKSFHSQLTLKINNADQTLKLLSEKLKDLDDSTTRNTNTVRRQEDEELSRIEETLDWDTNAIEEMEKEQSVLTSVYTEIKQKLIDLEPKVEDCIKSLPTVESGIRSLLKVSNEILVLDKKMNEMTVKVFNTEDNLLKVISEVLELQRALESMQFDNSILKILNVVDQLKEKTQNLPSSEDSDLEEEEKEELNN